MNVYLMGYRCAGKTIIGKKIANRLELSFLDIDQEIINHFGITIIEIVNKYGWAYFRGEERKLLAKLSYKNGNVISAGAGIMDDYRNIVLMKKTGIVVWFKVKLNNIKDRFLNNLNVVDNRPSLTGKEILDDIDRVYKLRSNSYKMHSDFCISTNIFDINIFCYYITLCII